ncbi:MAG TPA: sigma-70 family RNA polymerase sigma factor [Thermomicrobiales bacterium]|nr:sigma-70 family RNA polymerase sigma factor [Thermomicrobiales bacterium]
MRRDEERALALAARGGDAEAFGRLVRLYQQEALRGAFLLTGDRQAAEDIAQNTFLRVYRRLDRYDPARAFRPWFFGVLANEARAHRRRERRQRLLPWARLPERAPGASPDPLAEQAVRDDERARVRAALAALAEPYRTTAVLYYVNDLPVDEVAAALGCRAGTVKSRLHTARRRLRALLAPAVRPDPPDPADAPDAPRRVTG